MAKHSKETPLGKIIGVIALKGGVGKTVTTLSLAAALSEQFKKHVLVVDANFSSPHAALALGFANPEVTLHHVLTHKAKIEDAIYETNHGFHLLPGALVHDRVNPYALKDKLDKLRSFYDMILIDSSPALNEEVLASMMASDGLLVVSTPDHVTLHSTLRAIKTAKQQQTPIHGIILNKVHGKSFELPLQAIEDASDTKVLAVLPYEVQIQEALAAKKPATSFKDNEAVMEYRKLAAALIGQTFKDTRLSTRVKNFFNPQISRQEVNRDLLRDQGMRR